MDDRIFDQHVAVLGKTGAGKTTTGKLIVERVVDNGARVCILDPIKSDWWGLTSSDDGKLPGLPFTILGGPRGHVPLHSSAGAAIAEIVADARLRLSILDMADFEPGGQARFFVDFAPMLLRKMRGVLYLVLEEAHLFAPKERSGIGAENLSIHWAKTLATAGRSKGIRLILLTQRTQALHNALLGSCDTMIAHRLTAPADQKPVNDWLKANVDPAIAREVAASLSSLKTGEAWVCSGEARIFERKRFPRISTFDNSKTPTDDEHAQDVTTAKVDVDALRAIVGDAVIEAEANDPKKLRARIADLERQQRAPVDPSAIEAARSEGYGAGYAAALDVLDGPVHAMLSAAADVPVMAANLSAAMTFARTLKRDVPVMGFPITPLEAKTQIRALERDQSVAPDSSMRAHAVADRSTSSHGVAAVNFPEKSESSKGGGAELRILRVLASRHPARFTMAQWATLSIMKRTGGTWGTYVSRLRTAGYIDQRDGYYGVTDAGMRVAGPVERPRDPIAMWKSALGGGAAKMLDAIIAAESITRERLAEALNMTASGGTFGTYLSRLRSNGLIEISDGKIRLSRHLWG